MGSQKLLHWEGSSLVNKYQSRVKVTDSVRRSSFPGLPNNYSFKPFYDTAPLCFAVVYYQLWRQSLFYGLARLHSGKEQRHPATAPII
jgi:hypothetical protein